MLADHAKLISRGTVFVLDSEMGIQAVLVMMRDEDGMFLENMRCILTTKGEDLADG